ncbi:MAG TPA: diacylglycerol kinase family protein [Gaiellaceae bacterium]|nr:diacylglycerol kinase family protein [Gaiellaceae bacterium]
MPALLLVNPFASQVDERVLARVREALPAGTEVRLTSRPGEATELAREAAGRVEALYVLGGDGTFNEVLNGIDAHTPLGLLPGGGTSVLPRALGLPRDPAAAAARLAAHPVRCRISVGRVNGRRFGFAAGVGLDAEVVRAVDERGRQPDGRRPGDFAYVWTALRRLARSRFRLEPALEVRSAGRAASAFVVNAPVYTYLGRVPVRLAPGAAFEGGLDLVAPTRVRARDVPLLLAWALAPAERRRPAGLLYLHDAERVEVVCDRPLPLQADGEDLGDVEEAVFEAERGAVTVLVSVD